MSTYEYTTVPLNHQPGYTDGPTIGATLNELADEGWRLVAVLEKHHYPPLGILERAVPPGIARGGMVADRGDFP